MSTNLVSSVFSSVRSEMCIALPKHRSSQAPSGAKCKMVDHISLLTELENSGQIVSYTHLAPDGANGSLRFGRADIIKIILISSATLHVLRRFIFFPGEWKGTDVQIRRV